MKSKKGYIIKTVLFSLIFGIIMFSVGFFYLNGLVNKTEVIKGEEKIPYYHSKPENFGVLLNVCENYRVLYFNFSEEALKIVNIDDDLATSTDIYGYTVKYNLSFDYSIVGYLVDEIGGIELEFNNKSYRYTGIQITEMFEYESLKDEEKNHIIRAIIDGFSEIGFSKENLLYVLQNSQTDIKFNDGYLWVNHLKTIFKFPEFIDLRRE